MPGPVRRLVDQADDIYALLDALITIIDALS